MGIYSNTSNNIKCLYHDDADGYLSAFWVSNAYPSTPKENFYVINYGNKSEDWFNNLKSNDTLIIVDYSLELDVMRKVLKKVKNVIWIDHHKTSIEKYKDFEFNISGLRYDGIAASMLTWCYFNKMNGGEIEFDPNMTKDAPMMTKLVADHDVWTYEFGDTTRYFKLVLDSVNDLNPFSKIWKLCLDDKYINRSIKVGKNIKCFRDNIGIKRSKEFGFECEMEGYKGFALNNCFGGSEWFGDIINDYDFVCAFVYMGKSKAWEYSFYSEKDGVDCAKIARSVKKNISAGGHLKAAGAVSEVFIF